MPATTPIRGLPYPVDADPIDTAGDMQRLAEKADSDAVPRFLDAAARDAAIPAPVLGQMCYVDTLAGQDGPGPGELQRYHTVLGVPQWDSINTFEQVWCSRRVMGGAWNHANLVVKAEAGSSFASPMISFWDVASSAGMAASISYLTSGGTSHLISFNNDVNTGRIPISASEFRVPVAAGLLSESYADLELEVVEPTGDPGFYVDVAALALRLAEQVVALTERIAALEGTTP